MNMLVKEISLMHPHEKLMIDKKIIKATTTEQLFKAANYTSQIDFAAKAKTKSLTEKQLFLQLLFCF